MAGADEVERIRSVYAGYGRDGRAARWAQDRSIHHERAERLAGALDPIPDLAGARVLDLGCGRGDLLDELVAAGADPTRVVGVDLLPDRLALAHRRGLAAAVASGTALPFPDGSFVLVTAFTLLSSVADPDVRTAIAAEVGRVLRPGGAVVVYDLRLPNPANRELRPLTRAGLADLFPGWAQTGRSLTVLPPLARRLAPEPGARYDLLVRVPALRSHRLTVLRPPATGHRGSSSAFALPPLAPDATVSVVMPVRDEAAFLERSLGAVLDQEGTPPVQVVVVDGHSSDGTPDLARSVAARRGRDVVVLDNPAGIVPISMNLGLARATGDVVVRVDGHCVVAPDYVARCLDALRRTGAACVGGPMATVGETPVAAAIATAQSSRIGVGGVAFRTSDRAAYVDTLAFGAYRREVFDRIGGFDRDLVRNQDDELNLRLTRAGGKIWMDPTIRSTYFSRGTLRGLWRQYHGYGFYKVRVMRKHRTIPSPRHLVPAAFVGAVAGSIALSAARRSPRPAAAVLGPYAAAVVASAATAGSDGDTGPRRTVAAATTTMHVAYGLGWWAGLAREVGREVRRRRSRR